MARSSAHSAPAERGSQARLWWSGGGPASGAVSAQGGTRVRLAIRRETLCVSGLSAHAFIEHLADRVDAGAMSGERRAAV